MPRNSTVTRKLRALRPNLVLSPCLEQAPDNKYLDHSYTNDDGTFEDRPPQHPIVVTVKGVFVSGLPGLEELLS